MVESNSLAQPLPTLAPRARLSFLPIPLGGVVLSAHREGLATANAHGRADDRSWGGGKLVQQLLLISKWPCFSWKSEGLLLFIVRTS